MAARRERTLLHIDTEEKIIYASATEAGIKPSLQANSHKCMHILGIQ